jgi:hypothetical protein
VAGQAEDKAREGVREAEAQGHEAPRKVAEVEGQVEGKAAEGRGKAREAAGM